MQSEQPYVSKKNIPTGGETSLPDLRQALTSMGFSSIGWLDVSAAETVCKNLSRRDADRLIRVLLAGQTIEVLSSPGGAVFALVNEPNQRPSLTRITLQPLINTDGAIQFGSSNTVVGD